MKKFFVLFFNELKKLFIMTCSYPLNVVVNILTAMGISIASLCGINMLVEDLSQFYCLLFMPIVIGCVSSYSNSYKFDTMIGVIEQISNCKYGLHNILFVRYCVDCVLSLFSTFFLIMVAKIIFSMDINIMLIIISILILFVGCYFIGLVLFGIIMVFRKIDSIFSFINIIITGAVLYVMVIGISNVTKALYVVPFFYMIVIPSIPFQYATFVDLLMILINAMFSNIFAYYIYKKLFEKARELGTIGQY